MVLVPARLSHLLIDEQTDSQVVYIAESEGERTLQIVIGPLEASAIHRALTGEQFARPLTHDLLASVIATVGCELVEVRIVDLKDGTYYAELVLADDDGELDPLDCRPSDALAVLVRHPGTPLRIADHVFDAAGP